MFRMLVGSWYSVHGLFRFPSRQGLVSCSFQMHIKTKVCHSSNHFKLTIPFVSLAHKPIGCTMLYKMLPQLPTDGCWLLVTYPSHNIEPPKTFRLYYVRLSHTIHLYWLRKAVRRTDSLLLATEERIGGLGGERRLGGLNLAVPLVRVPISSWAEFRTNM